MLSFGSLGAAVGLTFQNVLEHVVQGNDIDALEAQNAALHSFWGSLSEIQKLEITTWAQINGDFLISQLAAASANGLKGSEPPAKRAKTSQPDEEQERPAKRVRMGESDVPPASQNELTAPTFYEQSYRWLDKNLPSNAQADHPLLAEFQSKSKDEQAIIACIAAQQGKTQFVEQLFKQKIISPRTHYPDKPWATPLYFAAANQKKELGLLILSQTDVRYWQPKANPKGYTPFHMAVCGNDLKLLQDMIAHIITQRKFTGVLEAAFKYSTLNLQMKKLAEKYQVTTIVQWIEEEWRKSKAPEFIFKALIGDLDAIKEEWLSNPPRLDRIKTALIIAAQSGRLDVITYLVSKGANFKAALDKDGNTALMYAAKKGHVDVVKYLLKECAANKDEDEDQDEDSETALMCAADNDGKTALMLAAEFGHVDVVEYLVSNGADLNAATNNYDKTALMFAAENGHVDVVKYLLKECAANKDEDEDQDEDSETALMCAAENGHLDLVEYLVNEGVDFDAAANNESKTALIFAAENRHLAVVKYLVNKGADFKAAANEFGNTALMCAAAKGYLDLVEYLVDKGADFDAPVDRWGSHTLMCAAGNGHLDVVKYLVNKGAKINQLSLSGETALIMAAQYGKLEVVEWLVEKSADITVANAFGKTALMFAAKNGHLDVVKYLVSKGADLNAATNNDGKTALMLAAEADQGNVFSWLLAQGPDIDRKTTLLMSAAYGGNVEIIAKVLKLGAGINERNSDGNTALMFAAENGHLAAVKYLLQNRADINAANEDGKTALVLAAHDTWMCKSSAKYYDVIEALVNKDADTNKTDKYGYNALALIIVTFISDNLSYIPVTKQDILLHLKIIHMLINESFAAFKSAIQVLQVKSLNEDVLRAAQNELHLPMRPEEFTRATYIHLLHQLYLQSIGEQNDSFLRILYAIEKWTIFQKWSAAEQKDAGARIADFITNYMSFINNSTTVLASDSIIRTKPIELELQNILEKINQTGRISFFYESLKENLQINLNALHVPLLRERAIEQLIILKKSNAPVDIARLPQHIREEIDEASQNEQQPSAAKPLQFSQINALYDSRESHRRLINRINRFYIKST